MITNKVNISKESFPLKPLGKKPPYFTYKFIPSESGQWIGGEQKTDPLPCLSCGGTPKFSPNAPTEWCCDKAKSFNWWIEGKFNYGEQKTGPFHLTEAAYLNSFDEIPQSGIITHNEPPWYGAAQSKKDCVIHNVHDFIRCDSYEEVKEAISAGYTLPGFPPLYVFPSAQPPLAAEKAPACE